MIDAEDLLLAGIAGQFAIELMSGLQIVAEGFFHDNALPAVLSFFVQETGAVHLLDYLAKLTRQGSEVKKNMVAERFAVERGELFFEFGVSGRVSDIALALEAGVGEFVPDIVI